MQVVNNTAHLTKPKTDSCTDNTLLLTRKVQKKFKLSTFCHYKLITHSHFFWKLKFKQILISHSDCPNYLKIEGRNIRFLNSDLTFPLNSDLTFPTNSDLTFPPNSDLTFPLSQFLENWKWECEIRNCILLMCATLDALSAHWDLNQMVVIWHTAFPVALTRK